MGKHEPSISKVGDVEFFGDLFDGQETVLLRFIGHSSFLEFVRLPRPYLEATGVMLFVGFIVLLWGDRHGNCF